MSKRYYLSRVIGSGTTDDPRRAAIEDYGITYVAEVGDADWALCLVASRNHLQFRNDPNIDPLPDYPLDAKINSMHDPTRAGMWRALERFGVNFNDLGSISGYREVIRRCGQTLNPSFSEDRFDVADVP